MGEFGLFKRAGSAISWKIKARKWHALGAPLPDTRVQIVQHRLRHAQSSQYPSKMISPRYRSDADDTARVNLHVGIFSDESSNEVFKVT